MPSEGGADGYSALEALICRCVFLEAGDFLRGEVRVENQQDAAIILARKFANHQRTVASGSLPVNVTRTICSDVIPQRVKILAAALRQTFESSLDAWQDFQIFLTRSDGWIDEGFRFQIEKAGLLQKS